MKKYFSLLDAVRFFAAFWVMNFHYLFGLSWALSWYRYGNLGVQLFFIISGFVIVQSLQGKNLKEFALGRFIRLFPLFWILCTLTYLITLIVPHTYHVHFTEYLSNLTMLGDKFSGISGYGNLVDPSYWTLAVELIFYTGVGIFTWFFSYKNIRYFLISWLVISAFAFMYHIDKNFYIKLLLVRHAAYFIFGGALALIAIGQAKNIYEKYLDWTLLFGSALYATYIHPSALPPYLTPNPHDRLIITMLHFIFFLGIPALVYFSPSIKNTRTIRLLAVLGGLTYPLYLLHQTIGNALINYGTYLFNISWAHFAVGFEVFIIGVAYVVYLEDKKLRAWLRKKLLD